MKETDKDIVFVYGTLMSTGSNPASSYVDAEVIGKGWVNGKLYDLGWYPGFYPDTEHDAAVAPRVWGELIAVNKPALLQLDDYEGTPTLYRRERIWATLGEDEELVSAWIYVFNNEAYLTADRVIPSGSWLEREVA